MATTETEHRQLVADAYEQARSDANNFGVLPPWLELDIDMRCALIHVFHAGAKHGLDRLETRYNEAQVQTQNRPAELP